MASASSLASSVALCALAVYAVYLALLALGWRRATRRAALPTEPTDEGAALPPLSVIVAARNEAAALPDLLDALSRQSHPDFEVIIVDDASTDDTAGIVRRRTESDPRFRLVQVTEPEAPRKKHALTRGIAAARYDLLAFTDADCRPGPDWLRVLARAHAATSEESVLVGYSPMAGISGLLGGFARYETLVAGTYAVAGIGLGRPFLAVGRNLSYPRAVFERCGGFEHSLDAMSGDDDLFVQHVHRTGAATVRPLLAPGSIVPTEPPDSWAAWFRSRRRHASAGRLYPTSIALHLTLFHGSGLLLWLAPAGLALAGGGGTWLGSGLLASGLLLRKAALDAPARTFDETEATALFPLWEFGYSLYQLVLPLLGLLAPPERW